MACPEGRTSRGLGPLGPRILRWKADGLLGAGIRVLAADPPRALAATCVQAVGMGCPSEFCECAQGIRALTADWVEVFLVPTWLVVEPI